MNIEVLIYCFFIFLASYYPDSNVAVLSFLELMNDTTPAFLDAERKNIIRNYIITNGITRKEITEYAPVFPDKVMRNLIESEVIYSVAP